MGDICRKSRLNICNDTIKMLLLRLLLAVTSVAAYSYSGTLVDNQCYALVSHGARNNTSLLASLIPLAAHSAMA